MKRTERDRSWRKILRKRTCLIRLSNRPVKCGDGGRTETTHQIFDYEAVAAACSGQPWYNQSPANCSMANQGLGRRATHDSQLHSSHVYSITSCSLPHSSLSSCNTEASTLLCFTRREQWVTLWDNIGHTNPEQEGAKA